MNVSDITDERLKYLGHCTWREYFGGINNGEDYFIILRVRASAELSRRAVTKVDKPAGLDSGIGDCCME